VVRNGEKPTWAIWNPDFLCNACKGKGDAGTMKNGIWYLPTFNTNRSEEKTSEFK